MNTETMHPTAFGHRHTEVLYKEEKWSFVKRIRQLKWADKTLDEDAHRLTETYKLFAIKASHVLIK